MFIESLKIFKGKVFNRDLHQKRMDATAKAFNIPQLEIPDLNLLCPNNLRDKLVKCRLKYKTSISNLEFLPYKMPSIRRFALVEDNELEYAYKFSNREKLENLYARRGVCDDILIVKNGAICDTYFANVVFLIDDIYVTPKSFLLNGTKRQYLLEKNIIKERSIKVADLQSFQKMYLINSMIDLEDDISVGIDEIYYI